MSREPLEIGDHRGGAPVQRRRPTSPVLYLLAAITTLLGVLVVGSLLSRLTTSPWWTLAGAAAICVVVPLGLSLWLRRLAAEDRRTPRTVVLLSLLNLLLLVLLVGLAGSTTRRALTSRGTWWVALVAPSDNPQTKTMMQRHADSAIAWLASAIPADEVGDQKATPTQSDKARESETPSAPAPAAREEAEVPATDVLGGNEVTPDAYLAQPPARADAGPASEQPPGVTTVAFRRQGSAIVVPVRLRGPRLSRDVRMLFDTGATYSTIDSRTLADLGLYVTSSDPTVDLRTANGIARRTITVIEGASVGRAAVAGGLTVALCDACAEDEIVGLLGLNYARHFRVTFDHAGGTLQLEPKYPSPSRLYDIRPFVQLTDIQGMQRANQLRISLWLENRSPRPLRLVRLVARAGGSAQLSGEVRDVASGRRKVQFEGRVPPAADGFRVEIVDASW